ncbi:MAG: hypothetical protein FJZ47_24415, partial [Candidatus Tectomicrobia bacterium]|nr:hypothetical protein [Candidatus Tectomicrobia bacterium]
MKAAIGNAEVFFLALLSGLLLLLPVWVPMSGGLLTALAPFPLIALAVKYPWRYAVGVFGLQGGLLLLGGRVSSLWSLGHYGLIVLAVSWSIRRGWSISQTMIGSLVLPCSVGVVLLGGATLFG